jgi:hypothetical protein
MKPEQKKPEPKQPPPKKHKMPSDKDYLAALGPCGK